MDMDRGPRKQETQTSLSGEDLTAVDIIAKGLGLKEDFRLDVSRHGEAEELVIVAEDPAEPTD